MTEKVSARAQVELMTWPCEIATDEFSGGSLWKGFLSRELDACRARGGGYAPPLASVAGLLMSINSVMNECYYVRIMIIWQINLESVKCTMRRAPR